MKKHLLIIATILLVAATTITIVSCKKENTPVSSNPESTAKSFYQPPQVDDMLAYLKDFKQRIQVRGNDDTMELDEALPEFGHFSDHLTYTYHIPRIRYGLPLVIHDDPLD